MRVSWFGRLPVAVLVSTLAALVVGMAGPAAAEVGGRAPGRSLPAARVFHDADQTIPSGAASFTAVDFNSERFDTGNLHDAPETSRLVAPVAGLYLVGANLAWKANAAGAREVSLRVNGTTIVVRNVVVPDLLGFNTTEQVVTTLLHLAADDFVEVVVRQTTGNDLDVAAFPDWSPSFWMTWTGPPPSP